MKKSIIVIIVILMVILYGCNSNTGNETDTSMQPTESPSSSVDSSRQPIETPDTSFIFIYDLVGKELEKTLEILNDNEINFNVVQEYDETFDAGYIVSQSIAPQSRMKIDEMLVITVSKGSEYVSVPNIVAMTSEESIGILESKQLKYEIVEINSDSVNENLVISQNPLPNAKIKIGEAITIQISTGPVKIQMIDLLNHTEAYVNAFFDGVNLDYSISYEKSNTVDAGKVISQSIGKDEYVNERTTIDIVISDGLVEFIVEDYNGMPLGEVTSLLNGHCTVETRLDYSPEFGDRMVIGQSIEAGSAVTIDSRIILTVNNWDEKPVSFVDAGLEQLIRNKINKQTGILIYSDVKDIANLDNYDIAHNKIRSLEGIDNLKSLASLSLIGENISDVSPLAELTEMRFLNLGRNNIQDISALSGLVKLEHFTLMGNQISDISIMANMPNLSNISLGDCPVSSISVISEYTKIDSLNISNTYIPAQEVREILSDFTRLKALHMTGIEVENLDFLRCYNTLKYLSADFCGLNDIECLSSFEYMQSLKIYHNEIVDLSPISNLKYLETLYIGFNDIQDISILENLTKISYLFISDIKTTDFSVLANLTDLRVLYISDNIIDNVEFLRPLDKLETLEMVSDIIDNTNHEEIINEHKARGCMVTE